MELLLVFATVYVAMLAAIATVWLVQALADWQRKKKS